MRAQSPARDRSARAFISAGCLALMMIVWAPADAGPTKSDIEAIRRLNADGKYVAAERASKDALRRMEKEIDGSMEAAEILDELSIALRRGGKAGDPQALEACERSLRIKTELVGPDDGRVAETLHNLGLLYYARGRPDEALVPLARALAIREKVYGSGSPAAARSLLAIGSVLTTKGNTTAARVQIERAIEIQRQQLPADDSERISGLTVYAGLLYQMGEFAAALPIYEEAISFLRRSKAPNASLLGVCYYNLGSVYTDLEDHVAARKALEESLRIRERSLGPGHPLVGNTLVSLAETLYQLGDTPGARTRYERAIPILEQSLGPEHPDLGWALMKLGWLRLETGSASDATALLRRALVVQENALGPENPALWLTLRGLATAAASRGDCSEALTFQRRALSIVEESYGRLHPDAVMTMSELAELHLKAGHPAEALEASLTASELGSMLVRLAARGLAERQALQYAAARGAALNAALSVLAGRADETPTNANRRVLDALTRSRTLVLDEIAARSRDVTVTGEGLAAAKKLEEERRRFAGILVRSVAGDAGRRRAETERARQAVERAERELASISSAYRAERARDRAGIAEVQAALPQGSALVSVVVYRDASGYRYGAFVLDQAAREPDFVPLGAAPAVEAAVTRWKELLSVAPPGARRGRADREHATREAGRLVREAIWDPLVSHLHRAGTVLVVPDGVLHLVNLVALPTGESGYLVEDGPLIHRLSSERDVIAKRSDGPAGHGLLAIGGVAYDIPPAKAPRRGAAEGPPGPHGETMEARLRGAPPDCGDFASVRFLPLPASALEVREVVACWDDPASAMMLVGGAARERALKDLAVGRRVLHLATHGFFIGGGCADAATVSRSSRGIAGITPSGGKPAAPRQVGERRSEYPLRLAGLALAGANQRSDTRGDEDDGILTAEEIASLDLSAIEWAVLSACDTGTGDIQIGEGVLGMQRAFQVAGVSTLIMSLWSVEDEAAREWMKALYQSRLRDGASTARAVREATIRVLHDRRAQGLSTHPFYWAAFVATGSWT